LDCRILSARCFGVYERGSTTRSAIAAAWTAPPQLLQKREPGGFGFPHRGRGSLGSSRSRCRSARRQDFRGRTTDTSQCRLLLDLLRAEWSADDDDEAMSLSRHDSSSRRAFASLKSAVSKPSVNQP
jgi:hypothetical protein